MEVFLPGIVGRGYRRFWNYKGRYRVVKGSRASKKSKTTALNLIVRMMEYPEANTLVVRKVYRTLSDSCFAELKWAVGRLHASALWECRSSPLEMRYLPTGQKIIFRGMDDPLKITSISCDTGRLCWMWVEEAFELSREEDFDLLDECLRGEVPRGLFKQITLTFNPWNEKHWLKRRFFDKADDNVFCMSADYRCNEWLDEADLQVFESMRIKNPCRFKTAGLGEWGKSGNLVFEHWREERFFFESEGFQKEHPAAEAVFGLDFGYTHDPTALFCGLIDNEKGEIYVFDEVYEKRLSNRAIFEKIRERRYHKALIVADSAEPKSIDELRELGLRRIRPARKGPDSIRAGIQFIGNYQIIIHPQCTNFLREIGSYCWEEDSSGRALNIPGSEDNHLMDAMRYAVAERMGGKVFSFE